MILNRNRRVGCCVTVLLCQYREVALNFQNMAALQLATTKS